MFFFLKYPHFIPILSIQNSALSSALIWLCEHSESVHSQVVTQKVYSNLISRTRFLVHFAGKRDVKNMGVILRSNIHLLNNELAVLHLFIKQEIKVDSVIGPWSIYLRRFLFLSFRKTKTIVSKLWRQLYLMFSLHFVLFYVLINSKRIIDNEFLLNCYLIWLCGKRKKKKSSWHFS